MYESFYNFSEKPFSLPPNPDFLYLSRYHRQGVNILEYVLTEKAGIALISGEVGSGKTTLIQYILRLLDDKVKVALITNTHRTMGGLLKRILAEFDLNYATDDPVELYKRFEGFLRKQSEQGRHALLIIDEAQNLTVDALEELRLISNFNTSDMPAVQIILSGQPEVLTLLGRTELRQLSQRISATVYLRQLTPVETLCYIRHRIRVAGGDPAIMSTRACAAAHLCSGGLPRLINRACDMALIYGYGESLETLDSETIFQACEGMLLGDFATLRDDDGSVDRARKRLREQVDSITDELERARPELDIAESMERKHSVDAPTLQTKKRAANGAVNGEASTALVQAVYAVDSGRPNMQRISGAATGTSTAMVVLLNLLLLAALGAVLYLL